MKYSTILLDIDETILDFSKAESMAIREALKLTGIEPTDELCRIYSEVNDMLWKRYERHEIEKAEIKDGRFVHFFNQAGIEKDPYECSANYFECLSHNGFLFDGAWDFIVELKKHFKVYAVTNGAEYTQRGRFKVSKIDTLFDDIFISGATGYGKPDKEYFDYVFNHIPEKDKSKIVIIGDSPSSDIKGAFNTGLDSIWFNPKEIEFPYEQKPTYTANSYANILKILL